MNGVQNVFSAYLHDLKAASRRLPPSDRDELVTGVESHFRDAVEDGKVATDADALNILERLGPAEQLVAATGGPVASPEAESAPGSRRHGPGNIIAWLTVGSFIPLLGWLLGVVRLWTSGLWNIRDKIIGTLCFPLGTLGALLVADDVYDRLGYGCSSQFGGSFDTTTNAATSVEASGYACSFSGAVPWFDVLLLALIFGAAIFGPVWLAVRSGKVHRL